MALHLSNLSLTDSSFGQKPLSVYTVNYLLVGGGGAGGYSPYSGSRAYCGGGYGGNGGDVPGNGGSGVVIVSYQYPTQVATGGTVTSYVSGSDTYWVHTFTSNGTLQF